MHNTIILKSWQRTFTPTMYAQFEPFDLIGSLVEPTEIGRWNIEEEQEALKELSNFKCTYWKAKELYYVEEFALEYCNCNEDGEIIEGSDYLIAEICSAEL